MRMTKTRKFTVYGHPQPQGSSRAFNIKGRTVVTSANRNLKPWRQQLSETMLAESGKYAGESDQPVCMSLMFVFERPKSAPKKRVGMTVKPDVDKLCRAILDAGTGILYHDDSQVISLTAAKSYGSPERAEIRVMYL